MCLQGYMGGQAQVAARMRMGRGGGEKAQCWLLPLCQVVGPMSLASRAGDRVEVDMEQFTVEAS